MAAPEPAKVAAAAAKIVEAARSQLGVPYVFGGEDPGVGFDCSGLSQWCCAQAGIAIPRGSADQFNLSTVKVTRQVQAGDLVFFYGGETTPPRPGHVGIVVRRGAMIDAPYTGVDVRYDTYSASQTVGPLDYYGATRPALLVDGTPAPPPSGNVCEVTLYVLKTGSSGEAVLATQTLLNEFETAGLNLDGVFGQKTETAVKTYQTHHGLTVDGVVGSETWGQLLGAPK